MLFSRNNIIFKTLMLFPKKALLSLKIHKNENLANVSRNFAANIIEILVSVQLKTFAPLILKHVPHIDNVNFITMSTM